MRLALPQTKVTYGIADIFLQEQPCALAFHCSSFTMELHVAAFHLQPPWHGTIFLVVAAIVASVKPNLGMFCYFLPGGIAEWQRPSMCFVSRKPLVWPRKNRSGLSFKPLGSNSCCKARIMSHEH